MGFQAFGGRDKFDHALLTSWPLEGKHQTTKCEKCHEQKTQSGTITYLKAPLPCAGCHNSPHGDLREPLRRCERCHDARSWKMIAAPQFDHDRDSRYPLEKKHEPVPCAGCHATKKNNDPPNAKTPIPRPTPPGIRS